MRNIDNILEGLRKPETIIDNLVLNQHKLPVKGGKEIHLNQSVIDKTHFTAGPSGLVERVIRLDDISHPGRAGDIIDYLNIVKVKYGPISFITESSKAGGAAMRAEGAKYAQSDRGYTEITLKPRHMGTYVNLAVESYDDVTFLDNELRTQLILDLRTLLSNQVLNGDASATQLPGILPRATAINAGSFALQVTAPTYLDALQVSASQVMRAGYSPSLAICHPDDYTMMNLDTDTTKGLDFAVVPSTAIAQGTFVVLDGSLVTLYISLEKLTFANQSEDNVINNRTTVIASLSCILKLAPINEDGVVSDTYANVITAITKP